MGTKYIADPNEQMAWVESQTPDNLKKWIMDVLKKDYTAPFIFDTRYDERSDTLILHHYNYSTNETFRNNMRKSILDMFKEWKNSDEMPYLEKLLFLIG